MSHTNKLGSKGNAGMWIRGWRTKIPKIEEKNVNKNVNKIVLKMHKKIRNISKEKYFRQLSHLVGWPSHVGA